VLAIDGPVRPRNKLELVCCNTETLIQLVRNVISNCNAWNGECEIEVGLLSLHSSRGAEDYYKTPQSVSSVFWRSLEPAASQILRKKSAHFQAKLVGQ